MINSTMSDRSLADEIEKQLRVTNKADDKVRELALNGHETLSQISKRVGPTLEFAKLADEQTKLRCLYSLCVKRYGADCVTFDSMWPTFLRCMSRQTVKRSARMARP